MGRLEGKVAVVTGATGGLGAVICHALARAGASVVVGYNRSSDAAHTLVTDLPTVAGGHLAVAAPVTDSAMLERLATQVQRHFGRCDILVNCAGTTRFVAHADLEGLDDGLIDNILAINVRGPIACIRALAPLLKAGGDGLVVNISSIAARTAMGSNIAYCASKAAVDNLTQSLARALAPQVRVVSVAPGLADTEFVQGLAQGWRDEQAARTPLGRLALPEEVAQAVLALACHLTFTTGAVIPVDGGRALS
ncbi:MULTISPECIES: SDR family NAD(P)-dependent oxidoreductase [unclassified Pseudomonas]|uniref:SDR family NAD(P)-dependent oxidoreductase n=1 Tax=unclassified Pseudomonas TaxID=196821 RepID=UPI00081BEE12|nr:MULTISPECIES: SDR family oxidoreductase [unclassified Pseudomonas]OCW19021.1 short-chain dehydrogenase [Pseudomonas sp. S3E12]QDG55184.1 SDR family oxidoreductase [Pseudomonas sp. NIBRBAC000502773]